MLANGYNAQRSGDFQIIYDSGWFEGGSKGTTYANTYNYDTHIPLLWMGWHIKHDQDHDNVYMTDIAPTLWLYFIFRNRAAQWEK